MGVPWRSLNDCKQGVLKYLNVDGNSSTGAWDERGWFERVYMGCQGLSCLFKACLRARLW